MPQIIQSNPKILGGQPVIRGTRVPVSRLLALVGMDYTLTNIKAELPDLRILNKKDLRSILTYYETHFAA
jgi:uncharacterized protein (DUF433 family)